MSELFISRIEVADVHDVVKILNEATGFKIRHHDTSWSADGWTEDEIIGLMRERDIFKLQMPGKTIGTFALTWSDIEVWGERPDDAAYLHALAIGNKDHGKGHGRIAVDWATTHTNEANRPYLRLDCPGENTGLRQYYEAQGFTHVDTRVIEQWDNYVAAMYQRPTTVH